MKYKNSPEGIKGAIKELQPIAERLIDKHGVNAVVEVTYWFRRGDKWKVWLPNPDLLGFNSGFGARITFYHKDNRYRHLLPSPDGELLTVVIG